MVYGRKLRPQTIRREIMRKKFIALALVGLVLTGCDTLGESTGMGALLGAGVAGATGGNVATGALIGAGAGALCHETNTC